jgi:hypothetical protein
MFYAIVVYGPPFSWDRIMAIRNTVAVQGMADDGEHADADLLTELVWKPKGGEIIRSGGVSGNGETSDQRRALPCMQCSIANEAILTGVRRDN